MSITMGSRKPHATILAADVGGTNTRLWLSERDAQGNFRQLESTRADSTAHDRFADIVTAFIGSRSVDAAAFGIAGPVVAGVCRTTNLPWVIDQRDLQAALGAEVALLNDLQAVARGILEIDARDQVALQDADVDPRGPVAVIAAGTGLGQAWLVPTADGPRAFASEGGHADFAPRDDDEVALLQHLRARHTHVSAERVVSGPGLVAVYEFLVATGRAPSDPGTERALVGADAAEVIGSRALAASDPTCVRAAQMFMSCYGAEAGNLALKLLPTGGLYIAGGIAPKLLGLLEKGEFMQAFVNKGRMSSLLAGIRVAVVTDPQVGLRGARATAASLLR